MWFSPNGPGADSLAQQGMAYREDRSRWNPGGVDPQPAGVALQPLQRIAAGPRAPFEVAPAASGATNPFAGCLGGGRVRQRIGGGHSGLWLSGGSGGDGEFAAGAAGPATAHVPGGYSGLGGGDPGGSGASTGAWAAGPEGGAAAEQYSEGWAAGQAAAGGSTGRGSRGPNDLHQSARHQTTSRLPSSRTAALDVGRHQQHAQQARAQFGDLGRAQQLPTPARQPPPPQQQEWHSHHGQQQAAAWSYYGDVNISSGGGGGLHDAARLAEEYADQLLSGGGGAGRAGAGVLDEPLPHAAAGSADAAAGEAADAGMGRHGLGRQQGPSDVPDLQHQQHQQQQRHRGLGGQQQVVMAAAYYGSTLGVAVYDALCNEVNRRGSGTRGAQKCTGWK